MRFQFLIDVEVERTTGKFAGRDELAEQVQEALDGANPGSLEGENGGEYEITDWEVNEQDPNAQKIAAKAQRLADNPQVVTPITKADL